MIHVKVKSGFFQVITPFDGTWEQAQGLYGDDLVAEVCGTSGMTKRIHISKTMQAALDGAGAQWAKQYGQMLERWTDIAKESFPDQFVGMEKNLTPEGDVVETPIEVEEPMFKEPTVFDHIANYATSQVVLKNLSSAGIAAAVKLLTETVGLNGFERINYADWIMDHGNSRVQDLIDVMCKDGAIKRDTADALTIPEILRLRELITAINVFLQSRNVAPHFIKTPTMWDTDLSALEAHQRANPGATVEDWLRQCQEKPAVVMNPNDPNSLDIKIDPVDNLKHVHKAVLNALDEWSRKVAASHGYFRQWGEARIALMEKQWKHIRRYAKVIVKRVVTLSDDFELIHLDVAERYKFGFVTRDRHSDKHTRHFTIKFVDFNWVIVEE